MAISIVITSLKDNQLSEEKEFLFSSEDASVINFDYLSGEFKNYVLMLQKDMEEDESSMSKICDLYKYLVSIKESKKDFTLAVRYNGFEQFSSGNITTFNYTIAKSEIKSGLMERLSISL